MMSNKQIESLLEQSVRSDYPESRDRIYRRLLPNWQRHEQSCRSNTKHHWTTRLVIAASLLMLLTVSVYWMDRSSTNAYAIGETALAIKDILHYHFQIPGPDNTAMREAWVEHDPNGQVKSVCVEFNGIGQVAVWNKGITQVWHKDSNELAVFADQGYTDKMLMFAFRHDPKHAIGYLRALELKGDVDIIHREQRRADQPIEFAVYYEPNTYLVGKPQPAMKEIYSIDPRSKLITDIEVFHKRDRQFNRSVTWQYIDYNQPMAPAFFDLTQRIPNDVSVFNTLDLDLGLEQGDLSDSLIAIKVATDYLNAWQKQDYDQAVTVHSYLNSGNKTNALRHLQKYHLESVTEIHEPYPAKAPQSGLMITCEVILDGTKRVALMNIGRRTATRWRIYDISYP